MLHLLHLCFFSACIFIKCWGEHRGGEWATTSAQSIPDATRTPELALTSQDRPQPVCARRTEKREGCGLSRAPSPSHSCSGKSGRRFGKNFLGPPFRGSRRVSQAGGGVHHAFLGTLQQTLGEGSQPPGSASPKAPLSPLAGPPP